jgi:hypothetical protein
MTQWNQNLQLGNDGKLYVEKVVGPADKPFFTAIVPAGEADLPKERISGESLKLQNYTKLSMSNVILVHSFFKEVYRVHKSEAIVLFHKDNTDDSEYKVLVPEATTASAGHLSYDAAQVVYCENCRVCNPGEITKCPQCGGNDIRPTHIYGTAHSHGSMSAFHSGTDDAHEKGQTGFHITFGKVDEPLVHIAPSFVVACVGHFKNGEGTRYKVPAEDLIDIPFSDREKEMISLWATLIFSQASVDALGQNDELVFCAERKLAVCWMKDSQRKALWDSCQPTGRRLARMSSSEYRKKLEAKPSVTGSTYGQGQSSPATTSGFAGNTPPKTTQVSNSVSGTSSLSGDNPKFADDEFVGKFLHYTISVDMDLIPHVQISHKNRIKRKDFGFESDLTVEGDAIQQASAWLYLSKFEQLFSGIDKNLTSDMDAFGVRQHIQTICEAIKQTNMSDGSEEKFLAGYTYNVGKPDEITVLKTIENRFRDIASPVMANLKKESITGTLFAIAALCDLMESIACEAVLTLTQLTVLDSAVTQAVKALIQEHEFVELSESYQKSVESFGGYR